MAECADCERYMVEIMRLKNIIEEMYWAHVYQDDQKFIDVCLSSYGSLKENGI